MFKLGGNRNSRKSHKHGSKRKHRHSHKHKSDARKKHGSHKHTRKQKKSLRKPKKSRKSRKPKKSRKSRKSKKMKGHTHVLKSCNTKDISDCKSRVGCRWANKAHSLGYYPVGCSERKKISHKHGKSKKHLHIRPKPVPKKPKKPSPFSTKHSHNFNGPAYPENRKVAPWAWYDDVDPQGPAAAFAAEKAKSQNIHHHQPSSARSTPQQAPANSSNSPWINQAHADYINANSGPVSRAYLKKKQSDDNAARYTGGKKRKKRKSKKSKKSKKRC